MNPYEKGQQAAAAQQQHMREDPEAYEMLTEDLLDLRASLDRLRQVDTSHAVEQAQYVRGYLSCWD